MQDSQFLNNTTQSFCFPNKHSQASLFKGIHTIIQECIVHGSCLPDPMKLLTQCLKFKCAPSQIKSCCCQIVFNQLDFVVQKSELKEHVELHGHWMIFYPKIHC